jgi:prepilin-type N-terminal cleavage/methylation domain-containing protein
MEDTRSVFFTPFTSGPKKLPRSRWSFSLSSLGTFWKTFRIRAAFTLIELLVVIAIIAVLAIVVLLTLNPGQLIAQARDANRFSDLTSIQSALGYYATDAAINGKVSLGSVNTVYASVPDPAATSTAGDQCQGLGLPVLPPTSAYHCAPTSTARAVDGTGWIPVDFKSGTQGSPLGQLPVDPVNTSSSRFYYTYTTDGKQFELTASLESNKYKLGGASDAVGTDGGTLASVYEKGTKLGLEPLDYGDPSLVGYWTFDEGTGTVAFDYSGSGASGTWSGTPAGTSGFYSAGRVGVFAGNFNGIDDSVAMPNGVNKILPPAGFPFTILLWTYHPGFPIPPPGTNSLSVLATNEIGGASGFRWAVCNPGGLYGACNGSNNSFFWSTEDAGSLSVLASSSLTAGIWNQLAVSYNGTVATLYVNGQATNASAGSINANTSNLVLAPSIGYKRWLGAIDDLRIYNRALSAADIQALYLNAR